MAGSPLVRQRRLSTQAVEAAWQYRLHVQAAVEAKKCLDDNDNRADCCNRRAQRGENIISRCILHASLGKVGSQLTWAASMLLWVGEGALQTFR